MSLNGREATPWTYVWTNLPKYSASGTEIDYEVVETSAKVDTSTELLEASVTALHDTEKAQERHLENTLPKTKVSVNKIWEGDIESARPDQITYTLSAKAGDANLTWQELGLADDSAMTAAGTKTANPAYSASWNNLPKYDSNGTKITYTVDESPVAGYTTSSTNNEEESEWTWTFTNKSNQGPLPNTGGIGTRIFYITGSILLMAAALLLMARRKRIS